MLENLGKVRHLAIRVLFVALALGIRPAAQADARTEFLVRMLDDAGQFRVRMQAALALGARPQEPAVVRALVAALRDGHPAVRAASASALARLGDRSALPALRAARTDRDAATREAVASAISRLERASSPAEPELVPPPRGRATYYVAVGPPSTQTGLSTNTLRAARAHVVRQVAAVAGIRVAPENETQAAARAVMQSAKLAGFYLDSSITKVELKPDGALRAQVSVIVGTYPGRVMRVMLSGAATVSGAGSSEQAKAQAVEAAFTGALRRLPQALEAGLARAD